MAIEDLRKNGMMSHLLDALDQNQNIGHYGRLVFAMIARLFLSDEELVDYLRRPDYSEEQARGLLDQVNSRGYSPPRPERIRQWQEQQEFPICPTGDPDACNVYKDLNFPDGVYDHIGQYHEQKAEATAPTPDAR